MKMEKPQIQDIKTQLPPVDKRVIVVTPRFRCLGYLDAQGIWRHDKDGEVIEGVTGWHFSPA